MSVTTEFNVISGPIATLFSDLADLPSAGRLADSDSEVIYANAYSLAVQGRYAEARKRFAVLALYRPASARFAAGMAFCDQKLGRYAEAIANYAFAAHLEPGNPEHMLSIAECEILQHAFPAATESLNHVIRFCNENSGHENTLQRAEGIRALIEAGGNPA